MGLLDSVVSAGQGLLAGVVAAGARIAESTREQVLSNLDAVYRGNQYEGRGLAAPWDKAPAGGKRTPLRRQKPSVQYDLARLIVDRPTALLFGEGRFPTVLFEADTGDDDADGDTDDGTPSAELNEWFARIIDEGSLAERALTWSRQGGALGTGVLTWCIVEGEFEFEAHKALHCKGTFHARKRSRLTQLEKRYKFSKEVQRSDGTLSGRTVTVQVECWHREVWTEKSHIIYVDQPVGDGSEPKGWVVADQVDHNFGFVPGVWVKNIDDGDPASVDGLSLLDGLIDIFEDIDRTLTQKSRAIRYNQEPDRVYFGLKEEEKKRVETTGGGSSRSLPSKNDGGGVELLELQGEGQRVAEEHVVSQRSRALDVSRVTAPEPERLLAAAKSGVALRMLFAPTLELVGELRQTYGRALREIFMQILRAAREGTLQALGKLLSPPPSQIPTGKVKLQWGRFFDPTPEDIDLVSRSATALYVAKLVDRETLVRWLGGYLGITDVAAVIDRLDAERDSEYGPMANGGGKVSAPGEPPDADDTGNDPAPSQPTGETVADV